MSLPAKPDRQTAPELGEASREIDLNTPNPEFTEGGDPI